MSRRLRARLAALAAAVLACPVLVLSATSDAAAPPAPAPPEVPTGFQDTIAIGNLTEPTAIAFAADGTAFVAMKSGEIRSFDYSSATEEFEPLVESTLVVNLSQNVHNFHDRGLTGIAVDPQLGAASSPSNFVYVNYAYNRDPRDNPPVVPKWNDLNNDCFASMGPPVVTGCVIDIRVARIPVVEQAAGWVASGPEQPLV